MADLARLKNYLAGFIRTVMARVDHLGWYEASVVSQNSDGTLELKPLDPRFPGLSRVPIALGIPGTTVTIPAATRVIFSFKNGDPSQPYVSLFVTTGLTTLNLTSTGNIVLQGGGSSVGRVGDAVAPHANMTNWMTQVSGYINGLAPGTVAPALPVLFATINAGAPRVKA